MSATKCAHCGASFECATSRCNRAAKIGAQLYCGRACAGLARRLKNPKTDEERRAAKAIYDAQRRFGAQRGRLLAQKREHYQANRSRILAHQTVYRKAHMQRHVEYCRQPEYKAWKSEYDRQYRAKQTFGEFAEAALLLGDIDAAIGERVSKYEIYLANGTINKAQQRRRAL